MIKLRKYFILFSFLIFLLVSCGKKDGATDTTGQTFSGSDGKTYCGDSFIDAWNEIARAWYVSQLKTPCKKMRDNHSGVVCHATSGEKSASTILKTCTKYGY